MAELTTSAGAPLASVKARAGTVLNTGAALVSLALVAGVGVWGYKLLIRDVTGVPVVRAIDGPMRMPAEEPGGTIADNQGLAVNRIAEAGTAAGPEDQVTLAPRDIDLADEDQPMRGEIMAEGPAGSPIEETLIAVAARVDPLGKGVEIASETPIEVSLNADSDVAALVEQLAREAQPLAELAVADGTDLALDVIDASIPGVAESPRPANRPADLDITAVEQTAAPLEEVVAAPTAELGGDDLPAGTRLVQLGAYPSADVAADEWERLSGSFGAVLSDKTRLIQRAQSNGRTFYRLRAMGFDDLSDARRFCSALIAEDAGCIPVVTR